MPITHPSSGSFRRLDRVRRSVLPLTVAAAVLLAAGCTAGTASQGGGAADSRNQTVVFAYTNEVTTLDPARSDYLQVDTVDQALYDTLVGYDKNKLAPRLATEFTYSDDVSSVAVTLRPDAVFHDGSPVTATDVKYTLDRYKRLGVGIFGQISSYASTTVTDDTHLTIMLKQPDALFLGALSRIWILNSKLVTTNAGSDDGQGWLLKNDAGSGPYALSSSSAGTIETKRFDKYWGFADNRPTTFTFRRIDEFATVRDELDAGTVDVGGIDAKDAATVEKAGRKTTLTPGGGQHVIYFNTSRGEAENKAIRQAIVSAFDYDGALKSIFSGQGTVANGPLPTTLSCRPDLPTQKQDLDKAKKILADAGLSNLTLTMRFQPVFSQQAQEATLLQSDLKQIGVTLKLEPIAFADYLTSLGDFAKIPDIMLLSESSPYPDTGVMVTKLFWSKSVGTNRSAYSNPKVDALIEEAGKSADADARCGLYSRAQGLVDADAASMALYTTQGTVGYRSDIGGLDAMASPGGLSVPAITVGSGSGS